MAVSYGHCIGATKSLVCKQERKENSVGSVWSTRSQDEHEIGEMILTTITRVNHNFLCLTAMWQHCLSRLA